MPLTPTRTPVPALVSVPARVGSALVALATTMEIIIYISFALSVIPVSTLLDVEPVLTP